jgi:hypothetical protein
LTVVGAEWILNQPWTSKVTVMKTIQRVVLVVVALSLFLGSRAEAAMLNLDFTVTLNGPTDANFRYFFFESTPPPGGLLYGFTGNEKPLADQTLLGMTPGTRHFSMTVDVADLSNFYFAAWGSAMYQPWPPSLFAASPLNGYDPALAWSVGPPWVSLATILGTNTLGSSMTIFHGPGNPLTGYTVGSWELTATTVPEPTSLMLLGTGVAVVLRRRHLAKKKSAGTPS